MSPDPEVVARGKERPDPVAREPVLGRPAPEAPVGETGESPFGPDPESVSRCPRDGCQGVHGRVRKAGGAVQHGEPAVGEAGQAGVGGDPEGVPVVRLVRLANGVDGVVRESCELVERPERSEPEANHAAPFRADPDRVPRAAATKEGERAVGRQACGRSVRDDVRRADEVDSSAERGDPELRAVGSGGLEKRVHGGAREASVVLRRRPSARGEDVEAPSGADEEPGPTVLRRCLEERLDGRARVFGRGRNGRDLSPLEEDEARGRPDPEGLGVVRRPGRRERLDGIRGEPVLRLPARPGSGAQPVEPPSRGAGPDRALPVRSPGLRQRPDDVGRAGQRRDARVEALRPGSAGVRFPPFRSRGFRRRRPGAPAPTGTSPPGAASRSGRRDRSRPRARPGYRPRRTRGCRGRGPARCSGEGPRGL